MKFSERPLAVVDLETSGLDAGIHEILDLAVLVVDQRTLKLRERYSARVRPQNIRRGAKRALEVVGYSPREWRTAVPLEAAMEIFSEKTSGAVLCSANMYLTRSFLDAAFKACGVEDLTSYHHVDLMSLAWARAGDIGMDRLTMDALARRLGIPSEPAPRRAANGARLALAVLKALSGR
ncbi:MAG TPA: 3'-5' exonuclease [Candidatus Paceibacterota bacterium]|nr:3'-5' exonuclease [Candidatus Paceibacterota bacterium]